MKANDGSGNIESRDTWQTPQKLWDTLNKQYGFSIDCCASKENKKCVSFFTDFEKVKINTFVDDIFWMNPPFSKADKMFMHFFKVVEKGVAIYRCDNIETKVWQEVILPNADWIFIPKGRICYKGMEGKGSRFPSALIGKGVDIPKELQGFTFKIHKEN